MPKVNIEFNLPEEEPEFIMATQAFDMHIAIETFRESLRGRWKHGDFKTAEARDLINELYKLYNEDMSGF